MTERDGSLDVVVTDDGRGFDFDARSTGFGLTGMRERVKLTAGTLESQARPTGTTVHARPPVRTPPQRLARREGRGEVAAQPDDSGGNY